jgi:acyl-CoA thioester hydrolase
MIIPEHWADSNGHMNMRWYVAVFDDAGDDLHARLGLTPEFHSRHHTGTFDLEHHTHFLSEVLPGDAVSVYARLVGDSAKRIHYLMFLVNERNEALTAIFECVNAFMDLTIRKMAPWPAEIAFRIREAVDAGAALDWPAPVCGAMRA